MRPALLAAVLLAAAALAACGGTDDDAAPALAPAFAERLAVASEGVANRLSSGDACGARERFATLSRLVRSGIADGRVPVPLRAELRETLAALDAAIVCEPAPPPAPAPPPPAPPAVVEEPAHEQPGKPKKDKRDKEKGDKGDNGRGNDGGDEGDD